MAGVRLISLSPSYWVYLAIDGLLCVPRTSSALIGRKNRLTSADHDRAAIFRADRFDRAIQVEELHPVTNIRATIPEFECSARRTQCFPAVGGGD